MKLRSFVSMLRCRIHILVRAEPMSLVAPEKDKEKTNCHFTHLRYASWPRKIWYPKRRCNPSGEHDYFPSDGFAGLVFLLSFWQFLLRPQGGRVWAVKAEPINVIFVWENKCDTLMENKTPTLRPCFMSKCAFFPLTLHRMPWSCLKTGPCESVTVLFLSLLECN